MAATAGTQPVADLEGAAGPGPLPRFGRLNDAVTYGTPDM